MMNETPANSEAVVKNFTATPSMCYTIDISQSEVELFKHLDGQFRLQDSDQEKLHKALLEKFILIANIGIVTESIHEND